MNWLGLVFVLLYSAVGYFADKLRSNYCKQSTLLINIHSISTGVLIAGLFFVFLDHVYHEPSTFFALLMTTISFSLFYALNLYQEHCHKTSTINKTLPKLKALKFLLRSTHHFLIGALIASWAFESTQALIFAVIPFLLLKTIGTFELAKKEEHSMWYKLTVESMTFIGFFVASVYVFTGPLYVLALGFVTGGMFYVIVSRVFARLSIVLHCMILGELLFGLLIYLMHT